MSADDFMMELYRAQYKYVSGRDKLWAFRKEQETGIDKEIWIGASVFTKDILFRPIYAALFVFNDLQLQLVKRPGDKDPDGELPNSQEKNMFRSLFRKYSGQPMFNTPNGRGPSDMDKFVKDNGLDDMVRDGVM